VAILESIEFGSPLVKTKEFRPFSLSALCLCVNLKLQDDGRWRACFVAILESIEFGSPLVKTKEFLSVQFVSAAAPIPTCLMLFSEVPVILPNCCSDNISINFNGQHVIEGIKTWQVYASVFFFKNRPILFYLDKVTKQ
jgi:hypothetical protein